jgi:hypothetical protein
MRHYLLQNILHQKLGLFFSLPPMSSFRTGPTGQYSEVVKFSLDNIDLVINNPTPLRAPTAVSTSTPKATELRNKKKLDQQPFDLLLTNYIPSQPMQSTSFVDIEDPVQRHGLHLKVYFSKKFVDSI